MAEKIGDSTAHSVREWCEWAQPIYAMYDWKIYNSRTGKMEVPGVEVLESICWDLLKQLDGPSVSFRACGRIGATIVYNSKELCLFPKVPSDG